MDNWAPRLTLENELHSLEARIEAHPHDLELRLERALNLTELGRNEEARDAYLDILNRDNTHFAALNNLGTLLAAMGFNSAARTAYTQAITYHPANPMAYVNLGNALSKIADTEGALQQFRAALALQPDHAQAHQGMAYVLSNIGDEENAAIHRERGFKNEPIMVLPYRGEEVPVALVVLASAVGKAVPIQHHLDSKVFFTSVLFVEFFDEHFPFPPHHLVFNAIGDADIGQDALKKAQEILSRTTAPVLNPPVKVLPTGRDANAARLKHIPGLLTPAIRTMKRAEITPEKMRFPFLLRAPGYHTGKYFMKIHNEKELAQALEEIPGEELLVIEFIDTRGADGKFRKYRVMMIEGQLYPLHAAVSENWKVHYFSADMAGNAEHRGEDEAFLNDMAGTLGPKAMAALERLCTSLGLDYAGVDFGLSAQGDVVLFEANATMFVDLPGPEAQWAYRYEPTKRIMDAVRHMLTQRAQKSLIPMQLP